MTGFPGWDNTEFFDGWYEINTEGIANLYLTITDEAIVTASTDDPPSKVYKARVLNAEQFSIKRSPIVWPWGDTSIQMAAFGQLQLDNYDGFYGFLVGADLRDTIVTIKMPRAMAFGSATLIEDAPIICTAVLDNVTCDNEDVITITLKDTLALLDKPLPIRINPPFVDSGAANRMVPLSFGACRNTPWLLIDEANRIGQLHDGPLTNIAAGRDMAAILDPNATPPQYTPALSASGVQLAVLPEGKLTFDCSSVGAQVVIPGDIDVLNGIGEFVNWDLAPGVPEDWDWSNNAGSLLQHLGTAQGYRVDNIAGMTSEISWNPSFGKYGDQLATEADVLESGKAYRITFKIYQTFSPAPYYTYGEFGGIMVRSAISNLAEDAISDHGHALTVPFMGRQSYVFEFRVPVGADRKLYFIATTAQGGPNSGEDIGRGGGLIYDVKLELLGEYLELPLTGMNLEQYFFEILINRAGCDDSIYNVTDLTDLDTETGYEFGIHYDEQPNILQCLRDVTDSYCATHWTDADGVIRTGRLIDPKLGTVVANFDETNVVRPISFVPDNAENLTTVIGARRNQSPFSDSDFVTNYDTVPADVRTRFKKQSQYTLTSSASPAGQYDFVRGAAIFHSVIDDPADAQIEIDRVAGIWSPKVYDDGTIITGKRRFTTFTTLFDDPDSIGVSTTCAVTDIMFGHVVTLNYPRHGFINTPVEVVGWEIFPFSKRLVVTGFY